MKVTKCNIAIKCDVDGCGNLATQDKKKYREALGVEFTIPCG